ncbi:AMP-binding protein [Hoeflea sp. TYP-13]|uniref:AMP-binding protein n=1 Tax=Hoeflea sp. TYP-13 TaxID=3230023 RepID=UPI0034C5B39E
MPDIIRSSYVHGVSEIPLRGQTIGACFDETAARHGKNDALIVAHQNVAWSYSELKNKVDAWAAGFVALGLKPGDRIGIWAPNCWEWVVTQFASAKAGLILVNINPAYRLAELQYALEKVKCTALITAVSLKSSNYVEMLRELLPGLAASEPGMLRDEKLPDLKWLINLGDETTSGFLRFESLTDHANPKHHVQLAELQSLLQFDDPINIQFTSGTTGSPKATTLTHHNIVNNAYFSGLQMELGPDDRMCIPVPMYHCFGMVLGTLCCVAHGSTMVFSSAGFDPHAVLETCAREKCTALHGVPTMFIAELDDPDFGAFDLSALRTGIMAGAPCPVELMKRVMHEMNLSEITIAYGMTETGPVSFQTSVNDPMERRVTTVGRVLPHTEIKIIDDNKRVVGINSPGELLTRGYCVMPGYWGDPERTAKAIDSAGWIASGDIATLDGEGYCQIVGRTKDMLIRGGENIFPREIEEYLYTHPKIEQVEVIGVPDEKYGEEICAWIKLREGEVISADDVRQFCKGKIAHFKIPRYIRFVDSYPMTVTGKVQKYIMRERMGDELSASAERVEGETVVQDGE